MGKARRAVARHLYGVRRLSPALLGLFIAAGTAGCLFAPRDPEPPAGGEIIYNPQTSASAVMSNLDIALQARDATGYLNQISNQAFRYEPDGQTTTDYPTVDWENWDRDRESAFINNVFNNVSTVQATLRADTLFAEPPTGTEVEWEFIYAVSVTSLGSTTAYRGRAVFHLALEGSFWYLREWRDEQGESDPVSGAQLPTLGSLRGAFDAGGG